MVTRAADVTMVPAGSAQREPSMEEILASIRRIIEDNDSGKKPVDIEAAQQEPNDEASAGTVIEVDAFRAELRAPTAVENPAPRVEPAERKPVTLAEVQAQIASEVRFTPPPRWTPETTPRPEPAALVEATPKAEVQPARFADTAPAALAETAAAPATAAPRMAAVAEPVVQAEVADAPAVDVPKPAAMNVATFSRPAVNEAPTAKPAILSERTERQVAAAFGELSEAFAARSKKTFDEMAEEMMRPMLQDWLDNNLPVLVERLVREEIERVARGAQ